MRETRNNQEQRLDPDRLQAENRRWWSQNPMAYDWRGECAEPPFSPAWFDRIDAAFIHGARFYGSDRAPFDRVIPFDRLRGRRVLEIGCGMGLHTELMARAGALVTAVDLTSPAVQATSRRLRLKQLAANVVQADAERLPFPARAFDFVWSWGVIHHSARTARVVREIARVLAPAGECRVMVYHRHGMPARIVFLRDFLLKLRWRSQSLDHTLSRGADGFSARFYSRDQAEDLFRAFFRDVSSDVLGMEADAVPLPRSLRPIALRLAPGRYVRSALGRRGAFVFVTARNPD